MFWTSCSALCVTSSPSPFFFFFLGRFSTSTATACADTQNLFFIYFFVAFYPPVKTASAYAATCFMFTRLLEGVSRDADCFAFPSRVFSIASTCSQQSGRRLRPQRRRTDRATSSSSSSSFLGLCSSLFQTQRRDSRQKERSRSSETRAGRRIDSLRSYYFCFCRLSVSVSARVNTRHQSSPAARARAVLRYWISADERFDELGCLNAKNS